jgi:Domain of unknown function (DUF4157)
VREFGSKRSSASGPNEKATATGPGPGKRTLTELLPATSAPVQRKADAAASVMTSSPRPTVHDLFGGVQRKASGAEPETTVIHESAQRGIATSASPLPHLDIIQRAFGRHDISGIQAHTGADAAASARAMGAKAYATGGHVVLGDRADLRTVAHETAHVVQQRGGVQLKGGIGAVGDVYERHADEVAERVVRGESAESLLDQHAGQRTSAADVSGVQMLEDHELTQLREYIIAQARQVGLPAKETWVQHLMNHLARCSSLESARNVVDDVLERRLQQQARTPTNEASHQVTEGSPEEATATAAPEGAHEAPEPNISTTTANLPDTRPSGGGRGRGQRTSSRHNLLERTQRLLGMPIDREKSQQNRQERQTRPVEEQEQAREARLRGAAGAAIVPQLCRATVDFVGLQVFAHTTDRGGDGTANISRDLAEQFVKNARQVESAGVSANDDPNYCIIYEGNLSIVFSTPDNGTTVNVFHIGPGARH